MLIASLIMTNHDVLFVCGWDVIRIYLVTDEGLFLWATNNFRKRSKKEEEGREEEEEDMNVANHPIL